MTIVHRPQSNRLDTRYHNVTGITRFGIRPLHHINVIMDRFIDKYKLENVLLPHAKWNTIISRSFQHDYDPKNISKVIASDLNSIDRTMDRKDVDQDKEKLYKSAKNRARGAVTLLKLTVTLKNINS